MAEALLDAVGCGSMVVDQFLRTPRIINADEKILLDGEGAGASEQLAVGGLVLNHLGWARVLGLETGIFGKMGDDRQGEFLRAGMNALGIHHHLTLDGSASSRATVFVDASGDRAIYMLRGATAELKPAEIRRRHSAFIRSARMVTTEVSQLPLATVVAILLFARAHAIPTVLDVDVPPSDACASLGTRSELERALKLATILKPAKAAASELSGNSNGDALKTAETLRARYGNRAVIITEGEGGCAIAARDAAVRVPAFRVRQIDSTGAGDAFLGGMLAGLRWDLSWEAIGRLANLKGSPAPRRRLRARFSPIPPHASPPSPRANLPAARERSRKPAAQTQRPPSPPRAPRTGSPAPLRFPAATRPAAPSSADCAPRRRRRSAPPRASAAG